MFPALRSCPLIWLALLGWWAQLCLPVAHAAVMAQQEAGLATWCGPRTQAMSAQLARLDPEVRRILEKGSAQAQQQDCAQSCASAASDGLGAANQTLQLRLAGIESAPAPAVPAARHGHRIAAPPRGPPPKS